MMNYEKNENYKCYRGMNDKNYKCYVGDIIMSDPIWGIITKIYDDEQFCDVYWFNYDVLAREYLDEIRMWHEILQ